MLCCVEMHTKKDTKKYGPLVTVSFQYLSGIYSFRIDFLLFVSMLQSPKFKTPRSAKLRDNHK